MIPLNLPKNYDVVDPGFDSLEQECPWMTPESVDFLVKNLSPEFNVLEIGSGGSTFFFARRCKSVTAVELHKEYYELCKTKVQEKKLTDKIDLLWCDPLDLLSFLDEIDGKFDVISVDHGVPWPGVSWKDSKVPDRSQCFDKVISKWTGKIFVMDNYAKKHAWPKHNRQSPNWYIANYPICDGCQFKEHDHPSWAGKGTKIISNPSLL